MTVIAYRDRIMAADTGMWSGDDAIVGHMNKIVRTCSGGLASASGDAGMMHWFLRRLVGGLSLEEPPSFSKENGFGGIRVQPDGSVERCGSDFVFFPVQSPWHAVGRPTAFLIGALAAGATAEQAVRLALQHSDGGGGNVQVEHL